VTLPFLLSRGSMRESILGLLKLGGLLKLLWNNNMSQFGLGINIGVALGIDDLCV
jgi:hypothetical protein